MVYLPRPFTRFRQAHPDVWTAYENLASACHDGPLGERERELVKLGVAIGAQAEGAVKSHVRRALDAGFTIDEVEHALVLALTTAGFPTMIAAREWAQQVFEKHDPNREGGLTAR